MSPSRTELLGLLLFLVLVWPIGADAQVLRGRVLDAESRAPVVGSIVKAVDAGDVVGVGTLSDDQGAFALTPPAGFEVMALVVERIGYATQRFDLARFLRRDAIELLVGSSPIELGGIVVTAESLCGARFRETGSVQAIWDEARKSLEITALSEAEGVLRYEVENFARDLRPSDHSALRGTVNRRMISAERPYRSISVRQMTERGWIEGNAREGMRLFAPDAAVLMTEEFAGQHCFRGEITPDAVLLHFVPNQQRRSYPELEGSLVLDPETAELTELRFRYVGIPNLRPSRNAAGEIAFIGAPNGHRIVREWAIRAPAMSIVRRGVGSLASEELRVDYVHEEGGRVLAVHLGPETLELPAEPLDLGPDPELRGPQPSDAAQVASTRPLNRSGGAELLLRNNDSRPFRVTHVQLRECINTALPCGDYPVDVVVPPGELEVLFRLGQDKVFEPFRFLWDYVGASVEAREAPPAELDAPVLSTLIGAPAAERFRSSRAVTGADIPEGRFANALEMVSAMRPQWLTTRAIANPSTTPPIVQVYVDDVLLTPFFGDDRATAESLRSIPTDAIEVIEYVDGPTATIRWGINHQAGAIVVTTVAGG